MNTTIRTRVRRVWMLACVLQAAMGLTAALGGAASVAAPAGEPAPVAAYVSPPDFAQVTISPDGRYLAALAPLKGKRNLMVLDLATNKARAVTAMSVYDVVSYNWVGSEFLVFTLGTLDSPTGVFRGDAGGLFAVRADGSGYRKLNGTVADQASEGQIGYRDLSYYGTVPGSSTQIIAGGAQRTWREDIYRVDLVSGRRELLTLDKPGHVANWVLDRDLVPRLAVVHDKEDVPDRELVTTVMIRDGLDSPWRELARFDFEQRKRGWTPVGFAPDKRNLIVRSSAGRRTPAYFFFDVESKQLGEMLVGHPRFDVSEARLLRDPNSRELVGVSINADQLQVSYFDPDYAALHKAMQGVFKDQVVTLQRSSTGRVLVTAQSDRHPASFHLYDEQEKTLKPLLKSRRALDERHLVAMRAFLLKTRDGLEIPSFYFLPQNYQPGQKLPTVVHVHGGPHVRADIWGPLAGTGVIEAQLLASRGYAVVLPNFRVTPGLGGRVFEAGFGEIGRKMSDDHEDAARWAVEQGFADAGRICISGASYGGYATLWASIRSADTFKCGIAGLVVSDMQRQLLSTQTDFHYSKSAVEFWKRMLGVKGDEWAPAHEVSPARHAERSAFPLFIYAGAADRRTPLEQTELMVSALKKAGKPAEIVMIKGDEGHGFGLLDNRIELAETKLKFLDKHIGRGPSQP